MVAMQLYVVRCFLQVNSFHSLYRKRIVFSQSAQPHDFTCSYSDELNRFNQKNRLLIGLGMVIQIMFSLCMSVLKV